MTMRTWLAIIASSLMLVTGCGSDQDDTGAGDPDPAQTNESDDQEGQESDDAGATVASSGREYQSDAAFTFIVPDGWSVARTSGFDDNDYNFYVSRDSNAEVLDDLIERYGPAGAPGPIEFGGSPDFGEALADDAAQQLAYVYISLDGPPLMDLSSGAEWPWNTVEDIETYIGDQWPEDAIEPIEIGSHVGFRRTDELSDWDRSEIYELLASPGVRVFAINQIRDSIHGDEIEAIVASVRPK